MPSIPERDFIFLQRLNGHPVLRARVESLLGVVEDAAGDLEKADAAERRVIEELRQMGNEVLTAWAQSGIARCAAPAQEGWEGRSGGKKNSTGIQRSATSR
jgi:hypothetical protein